MVYWGGLLTIGKDVVDDKWISSSGLKYRDGYSAIRKVVVSEITYDIVCIIKSSTLNKPLFECQLNKQDELFVFCAVTPTTAMKKAFSCLDFHCKKNWNGNDFFGLKLKDVESAIAKGIEHISNIIIKQSHPNVAAHSNRQSVFIGLKSVGIPHISSDYIVNVGAKSFRLQPGYESIRSIETAEGVIFKVTCRIKKGIDGPLFSCSYAEEFNFTSQSYNITESMNLLFEDLKIIPKKKWSGYEFYGLTRPEILTEIIQNNSGQQTATINKKMPPLDYSVLLDAQNVRQRNAGPTSLLKSSAAQKKRNELIHELVKFSSFGDVKGFNFFLIYSHAYILKN